MAITSGNYVDSDYQGEINLHKGLKLEGKDYDIDIGTAAASFNIATLPAGAVLLAAYILTDNAVSATTATKIGLGTAADPDTYGLSTDLTPQTIGGLQDYAVLAASTAIKATACDNAGDATGTIGGTGETLKARLTYYLPDAP